MIYYFNLTKVGYLISVFAGLIGLVIFFWPISLYNALWLALRFALWLLLTVAVFSIFAHRKVLKIYKLLDNCDLESFTAHCERMLKSCAKGTLKGDKSTIVTAMLNLSTAYLVSGNREAAVQVLSEMANFLNNRIEAMQVFLYHNNFFTYYLQDNDLSNAAQSLAQMEQALQSPRLLDEERNRLFNVYAEKQCLLKMANGSYDGSEQIFDLAYQRERSALAKVSAKYVLGRIYLHDGRTAEAKTAFEYVVEHGGTTIHKKKAVERLEAWGESFSEQQADISNPASPDEKPLVATTEYRTDAAGSEMRNRSSVLAMNERQRKQYNLVIFVSFGVFFVLFGGIAALSSLMSGFGPFPELPRVLSAIVSALYFGLFSAWGFTSMIGGIWLGCRFISREGTGCIVVACLLLLITLQIFWFVGLFVTIPFAIYNVVWLRRRK